MGMWPRDVFEESGSSTRSSFATRTTNSATASAKPEAASSFRRDAVSLPEPESWRALAKQFYQYGLWKVRVLQKHPAQMSMRHFVPPGFDAGVVFALLAGHGLRAVALTAVVVYGGVVLLVGAAEGRRGNRLRTALALSILHHAGRSGFLVGLVRFAPRWFKADPPARRLMAGAQVS